ncbi:MAG: DUF389 domain-containing protein [Bacteroidota bacterium]
MVIAPIIGPLLAVTFGLTIVRMRLVGTALWTSAQGFATALVPAVLLGLLIDVDLEAELLALRTQVTWWDLGVGLAAGIAGAVSFAQDARTAMVGVMVAVALVPPVAAMGLCLGEGAWSEALRALGLAGINVGTILAAGVVTFLVLGVRPASEDEGCEAESDEATVAQAEAA